jgi:hypothetical protein
MASIFMPYSKKTAIKDLVPIKAFRFAGRKDRILEIPMNLRQRDY